MFILNNANLDKLLSLKHTKASVNYLSPAWSDMILPLTDVNSKGVMTKSWLVGFIVVFI